MNEAMSQHIVNAREYQAKSNSYVVASMGPVNSDTRHHLEQARVYALMAQNEIELAKLARGAA